MPRTFRPGTRAWKDRLLQVLEAQWAQRDIAVRRTVWAKISRNVRTVMR